jgi:hypothetical protein
MAGKLYGLAWAPVGVGLAVAAHLLIAGVIADTLRRVDGYTIAVEEPIKSLQVHSSDDVTAIFKVRNISSRNVTIEGIIADCSCVHTSSLPAELKPGEQMDVTLGVSSTTADAGTLVVRRARLQVIPPSPPIVLEVRMKVE